MNNKIKNLETLSTNETRRHSLLIAEAGLQAIDTKKVLRDKLQLNGDEFIVDGESHSILGVKRLFVAGVGKCVTEAAVVIEELLGDKLTGGIILGTKDPKNCIFKKIKCYTGTHPFPSDQNVQATGEIIKMLTGLNEDDFVIFLISGGGSTLLCQPGEGAVCLDEKVILEALFKSGANIEEINTIRKHTSSARGGFLSKHAYPAKIISLIFVDVPGGDVASVASGPTIKDKSTVEDADRILEKYNILQTCGISHCGLIETPKEDKFFDRVTNKVLVSNDLAVNAMAEKARELDYDPKIYPTWLVGEAKDKAKEVVEMLHASPTRTAFIMGGETTVTFTKSAEGGRSQEMSLSALRFLQDREIVLPFASDGRDNSDYAGAIADVETKNKAERAGLNIDEYLEAHNETPFFEKTGDLLECGETGSNVADLLVALKN